MRRWRAMFAPSFLHPRIKSLSLSFVVSDRQIADNQFSIVLCSVSLSFPHYNTSHWNMENSRLTFLKFPAVSRTFACGKRLSFCASRGTTAESLFFSYRQAIDANTSSTKQWICVIIIKKAMIPNENEFYLNFNQKRKEKMLFQSSLFFLNVLRTTIYSAIWHALKKPKRSKKSSKQLEIFPALI